LRLVFQDRQILAESSKMKARSFLYYAIALPGLATVKLIVPAFYSTRDTKTQVIVAGISLVINVVLNVMFLRNNWLYHRVQNGGPALATGLACYFDFFALFLIFRLRYGRLGIREILSSFARISLCSAIMGLACWLGAHYTQFTIHSRF